MATKMLIFCGSDDPERVYPPLMLGSGAQAMDMELSLFFTLSLAALASLGPALGAAHTRAGAGLRYE